MASTVLANSNEVACKASDGKSTAAFPDVCFSPPSPPVGPMPLPYPNTAEDKDIDKGTAKVFIKDGMVSMQDSSCLKTSTGNEAATQNYAKGLLTSTVQGKAYFQIWSMDVHVEGEGVARHLDLISHNHASMQGNSVGVHTSSTGQGTATEGQRPVPVESQDIALDLKRDKAGTYYHFCGFKADDTKKFDKNKLEQYVNFENLTADEITFLDTDHSGTNRNLLKDLGDHCQLGRKLDFRVRFKNQETTKFDLKVIKNKAGSNIPDRSPSKEDCYIYSPNEKTRGKGFFEYSIPGKTGITAVLAEAKGNSTNANGQIEFSITLDASYANYIVTVEAKTSEGKSVRASLYIEAKRMLFYNIFLEREMATHECNREMHGLGSAAKTKKMPIENQKSSLLNKQRWQELDQKRLQNDYNKVQNELKETQKELAGAKRPKKLTSHALENKKFAQFSELTDQNKQSTSAWMAANVQLNAAKKDLAATTAQIEKLETQINDIDDQYIVNSRALGDSYATATFIPEKILDAIELVTKSYAAVGITLMPCRRFYFNEEDINEGRHSGESVTPNGGGAGTNRYIADISKIIRQPVQDKDYPCLIDFLFKGSLLSYKEDSLPPRDATILASPSIIDQNANPETSAQTQQSIRQSNLIFADGVVIEPIEDRMSRTDQTGASRILKGLGSVVEAKLTRGNISIPLTEQNFLFVGLGPSKNKPSEAVSVFRVGFPQSQLAALFPGQPVPDGEFSVQLRAKLRYAYLTSGFSLRNQFRAIICQAYSYDLPQLPDRGAYYKFDTTINADELKCTLAHELGHRLGIVPMGSTEVFILDKPVSVYYDENFHSGHTGPHCKYGGRYDRAQKNWSAAGTCIMFGAISGQSFCSECGLALEKTNCFIRLPGKYE